jgi:DASH complex subunit DAM1
MSELADETEALQANLDGLRILGDSLKTFNESFASWLYAMNMNALTTDWPQVCGLAISVFDRPEVEGESGW